MLTLWSLYKGGEIHASFAGMGGGGQIVGRMPGHLPDGGGTLDQPAIMLDAFGIMNGAAAQLRD